MAATFGKKRQALQALESGVVLMDQSHWGRLRVAGEDRIALLHNQSTADFKALRPGQGTDTVRPGDLPVMSGALCLGPQRPQGGRLAPGAGHGHGAVWGAWCLGVCAWEPQGWWLAARAGQGHGATWKP